MNVVDSSAWLEYFANGPNAAFFAPAIEAVEELVVPTIVIYEVFRRILQQRGEDLAFRAVAVLHQGRVVDLDPALALQAARLGVEERLPMADSIVFATARELGAEFWTQDADFEGRQGVRYRAKRPPR